MARKVRLISRGMRELLNDDGVRADLTRRMGQTLAAAQAAAPVDTGALKASLRIVQDTTDRVAVRVVSDVDYAPAINAGTGFLTRSLDAAGGA